MKGIIIILWVCFLVQGIIAYHPTTTVPPGDADVDYGLVNQSINDSVEGYFNGYDFCDATSGCGYEGGDFPGTDSIGLIILNDTTSTPTEDYFLAVGTNNNIIKYVAPNTAELLRLNESIEVLEGLPHQDNTAEILRHNESIELLQDLDHTDNTVEILRHNESIEILEALDHTDNAVELLRHNESIEVLEALDHTDNAVELLRHNESIEAIESLNHVVVNDPITIGGSVYGDNNIAENGIFYMNPTSYFFVRSPQSAGDTAPFTDMVVGSQGSSTLEFHSFNYSIFNGYEIETAYDVLVLAPDNGLLYLHDQDQNPYAMTKYMAFDDDGTISTTGTMNLNSATDTITTDPITIGGSVYGDGIITDTGELQVTTEADLNMLVKGGDFRVADDTGQMAFYISSGSSGAWSLLRLREEGTIKWGIANRGNAGDSFAILDSDETTMLYIEQDGDIYFTPQGGDTKMTGDADVSGTFTAGTKTFRIDNPENPTNSILNHISSESPEALISYRGRGNTEEIINFNNGNGWVYRNLPLTSTSSAIELPSWFNNLAIGETSTPEDFTVQITALNGFCGDTYAKLNQLPNNIFVVHTELPCKFSWMLQAVRQDPFYVENSIQVIESKNGTILENTLRHREKYVEYCVKHPELNFCGNIPTTSTTTTSTTLTTSTTTTTTTSTTSTTLI